MHRLEAYFNGNAYAPHRHDTYAIGITIHGLQRFDYRGIPLHKQPSPARFLTKAILPAISKNPMA